MANPTKIELFISKEVQAGIEECETYTVKSGKKSRVLFFKGEAAFSKNSAVKLVWDYNGVGEEVLWSTKGEGSLPSGTVIEKIGDGVKEWAVCLDNGETGPLYMSGFAEIYEDE